MGVYSEKTQRAVDKYFKHLVRRMPSWLKTHFQTGRIAFNVDPDGIVSLLVDAEIDDKTKNNAAAIIAKYMDKHTCEAMETLGEN